MELNRRHFLTAVASVTLLPAVPTPLIDHWALCGDPFYFLAHQFQYRYWYRGGIAPYLLHPTNRVFVEAYRRGWSCSHFRQRGIGKTGLLTGLISHSLFFQKQHKDIGFIAPTLASRRLIMENVVENNARLPMGKRLQIDTYSKGNYLRFTNGATLSSIMRGYMFTQIFVDEPPIGWCFCEFAPGSNQVLAIGSLCEVI